MAKILIVDDSDILRIELRETLESAGHQVVEGVNGVDGLEKATSLRDIDLLISDVNMPEMDGITMCRCIRALPHQASLPMFMLTTEASSDLKASGKEAGVMLWIVKPFNRVKVIEVVAKVLQMRKAA
jgi:two-component system chemotaxis response regulator CheY